MQTYKERNKKILIFFAVFLAFYGFYQLFDFPTFLFPQIDRYKDFATINYAMKDMNPYISWLSNYPPLILAFAVIFTRMNDWHAYEPSNLQYAFNDPAYMRSLIILFVVYAVFLAAGCVLYSILENKRRKELKTSDKLLNIVLGIMIAGMFFLSAPSRFMMDRGNYLVVTIVFMVFWAVFEEMTPDKPTGAVFASLAAATKVYPVYLLGSYLTEKKWKKLFIAIAVGAGVSLIPVFFFDGPFFTNLIEFAKGVMGFGDGGGGYAVYYTVGITGFVGVLFTIIGMIPRGKVTKLIWLFFGGLFTFLGFGFLTKEEKTWKKILIVTCLMIFLSPNSYLYNSCYLFAPILLMLMDNDKLKKADIPYYVMTALLLVPKSYFYFPNWGAGVPSEYSNVNIAVFFDGLLYFLIISYYLVGKLAVYTKNLKAVSEDKKEKLQLSNKITKIYKVASIVVAVLFGAYILYFCKDVVLACHDSLYEFIEARINPSFSYGFSKCFEYGLARGRVGVIFPLVVGFRYLINGTANYALIWLLQYVPVYLNIGFIGYIIGKKTKASYGISFIITFFGLLQIDIWHSLIVCYPLDFMYGLFIMILGLYLYNEYLSNLNNKSKKNIIRLIVSLVLFYESMQVYEAFIVSSIIYAIITFVHVIDIKKEWKDRAILFVKRILPHFIVAVIYLGILLYLRANPVVDVAVSEFGNEFNFKRFIITYVVLSFGMFPLFDLRIIGGLFAAGISKKGIILAALGGAGFFATFRLAGSYYSSLKDSDRKKLNRTLAVFAISGILLALTFAIPHALLPVYENWVVDNSTGGYVPTTICYFGWSVAILSVVMLFGHYFARIESKKRLLLSIAVAFIFAGSCYATAVINFQFARITSATGNYTSVKAQTIWAMISSDEIESLDAQVIYSPSMDGVHSDIRNNDSLFDNELNTNVWLLNELDAFEEVCCDYENVYVMIYNDSVEVCYVAEADDYSVDYDEYITSEPIYMVAMDEGQYEISYYGVDGVALRSMRETVTIDDETTAITLSHPARIDSIKITRE